MRFKRYGASIFGAVTIAARLLTVGQSAGAATKAPIVIGDICSCTGPEASSVARTTPTLQAWAKYVTAHGGIQGHPVQLIVKDDGYNPTNSLSNVETLVTTDHVVALFDNSDVDTAWTSYVAAHGAHPTSAQLEAGFYAMPKGTTLGGLSAPISFKKGVEHGNSCFFLMGIKHQKFVSLNNAKPVCVH